MTRVLLLALHVTQALVPITLPPRATRARVAVYSTEEPAAPAAPDAAPLVDATPAAPAPPAGTEDESLQASLEAALVAEEASAAARSTMAQSSVQKLAAAERLRADADAALARAADLTRQALGQEAEAGKARAAEAKASETSYAEVAAVKRQRAATETELAASLEAVVDLTPEPALQKQLRALADAKVDIAEADKGLAAALESAAQASKDAFDAATSDAAVCATVLATLPAPEDMAAVRVFDWGAVLADPKVRVDAGPGQASDARARAAALSKVVGEQGALRKLAIGEAPRAPAPSAPEEPAAAAPAEAGDVGSWLFK